MLVSLSSLLVLAASSGWSGASLLEPDPSLPLLLLASFSGLAQQMVPVMQSEVRGINCAGRLQNAPEKKIGKHEPGHAGSGAGVLDVVFAGLAVDLTMKSLVVVIGTDV